MTDIEHVPRHLRRYVVAQDYDQYTEVDQAVWRFVLLQTYQRLQHTAHSAYRQGLSQTGISVERIPRIAQMSASLEPFGWRAVCVDGFIPPRAFQEFQAAGILPIAADIRSKEHLVYTPAPDIIHEAAGHAPILPDARYAAYLRAIGEVGKKAFSAPEDARIDSAILELSELKETRGVPADLVTKAEARLDQALAEVSFSSEASRLSRLYWWTAEYGLIGSPSDYRLYGAGLLSSLWESHTCHDAAVAKLPLSADCASLGYDVTRTQPQLFVARDFDHLFSVLNEVDASLAHRAGGDRALALALRSEQPATLLFRDDRFIIGQLSEVIGTCSAGLLQFQGRVGIGAEGRLEQVFDAGSNGYRLPVGPLTDGDAPACLNKLNRHVSLRFASGVALEGTLVATTEDSRGRVSSARLVDYRLSSARAGVAEQGAEYLLLLAPELLTAHAGASQPEYFPESVASQLTVPRPHIPQLREQALLSLYERALAAFRMRLGGNALRTFSIIHAELSGHFPDEWLLRWNLLECLCKLGEGEALRRTLEEELCALELKFCHREPIASGLRYLATLAA